MAMVVLAPRLLAGDGSAPVSDAALVVVDGRIRYAGPASGADFPASAEVLEFADATVLPGLIDSHVHLAFDAGPDPIQAVTSASDEELFPLMAERAQVLLESGVTTARDLGDRGGLVARLRDAIAAGGLPGPRLLTSGAPITIHKGHCWFFGGEVDPSDEDALRRLVRRNVSAGADLIKVIATGGHMTDSSPPPWESQFTVEQLRVIVDEARMFGRPVAAHAHGVEGIDLAVSAGVSTIEHCAWVTADGPSLDEAVLSRIVAADMAVCPTASAAWCDEYFGDEVVRWATGYVGRMHRAGVRLIAGTDAGVQGAPFESYVEGLRVFANAGMPPMEIVAAATSRAAAEIGLGAETGRLSPGYRADVLVVGGDPLEDLDALHDVRLVLAAGRSWPG